MEGIIVINKPTGMTSHDVVSRVRRTLHMRRIGHAGTLDPLATGVLIILVGKATKLFGAFAGFDKAYRATIILGQKTTTADIQGRVVEQVACNHIDRQAVEGILKDFVGESEQIPPMYSAVKVQGRRLYQLARKGIEVERPARRIRIDRLELLDWDFPKITIYLECSKGTYVRQLAEDIGQKLETVACIEQIERTKVGPFALDQAVELAHLSEEDVRAWSDTASAARP